MFAGDAPMTAPARAPDLRFLLAHPAHLIACGFGSGLSPVAPGTFGTLFAWLSFLTIEHVLSGLSLAVFLALAFVAGVIACDRTGRALGVIDHGSIVWDEIVPFWIVLAIAPPEWPWQLAAFVLFRLFDITKPAPASYFDRQVKNGFGVMMDDVVAAAYTLLALALGKRLLQLTGWL